MTLKFNDGSQKKNKIIHVNEKYYVCTGQNKGCT